ncbi:hypothetical protein EsDP_00004657 [Epichloe bromicola]|uniref:Uncharacterized protein n=1 Tax=Epichloe bromicola TaxID=79588 RepID=A0ABQ0CSD8_9HYPO
MSSLSRKRSAAEDTGEDQRVSPKVAKKSKQGIEADGEDDDGNPFWEGISLSVAQYTALLKAAPAINATLQQLGQAVEDVAGLAGAVVEPAKPSKKEKNKQSKANIDATSDEED